MKKTTFVLALAAACFSGAVMAKDVSKNSVSKKAMNEAQMEQVVAGNNGYRGGGYGYGNGNGCYCGQGSSQNNYHANF